jgi:hypothetical protein
MLTLMDPTQQGWSLIQRRSQQCPFVVALRGHQNDLWIVSVSPPEAQLMLEIIFCFCARLGLSRVLNALGFS